MNSPARASTATTSRPGRTALQASSIGPEPIIDWIHRTAEWGDIYFVSSRWQPVEQVECSFRVTGKISEFWDPVSGRIREADAFRQENGRTTVPMRFEPFGSMFVVFRKPTTETARCGKNWWNFQPVAEVGGPWTITFDPHRSGPAQVVFAQLTDWTQRPEDGIKYYSGTATYRTSLVVPQPAAGQRLWLDLGEVRELAVVRINGKDLGTLWTKPFRVDVTDASRPGANHLEIDVVNLWPNRLIGDTFLSAEKRYTRTSMTKYTRKSQLLPSGLLGPVRILAVVDHPVTNGEKNSRIVKDKAAINTLRVELQASGENME